MATYPIKNIGIVGGDTYKIPEYWADTDDTNVVLHSGNEVISSFPVPTIQLSISSPVTPWNFNGTSFTSSDVSCNMSSLQVLSGITDNAAVWVHQGLDTFIATVKSQYQDGSRLTTIFESAVENDKVWQITLVTSQTGAFVSCTGDVIDLSGGGGGGGSVSVLNLTDGSGNSIPLTDAQQVGTVQLRLSGTPKTFTQVNTLLQSGSVVIKDSDGSLATIESTHAQSSSLVVPYFNGSSRNVLKLAHQWNGNYGVSSVN